MTRVHIRIRMDIRIGLAPLILETNAYLLLVAMSPFLHVEGSRTRLGAVVVGRYYSVWYILVSIVAFHLRMGNCSFFNAC
jgi:hypothetical protein